MTPAPGRRVRCLKKLAGRRARCLKSSPPKVDQRWGRNRLIFGASLPTCPLPQEARGHDQKFATKGGLPEKFVTEGGNEIYGGIDVNMTILIYYTVCIITILIFTS